MKIWSYLFGWLCGFRYELRRNFDLTNFQGAVYVSNHTSFLDTPALPRIFPHVWKALGKKELATVPLFGYAIKLFTVVVDRSSAASRKQSLDLMRKNLLQDISILIFPEGTMNRTKEPLIKFHDGAFRLAIYSKKPIIPMVTYGGQFLMPPSSMKAKPGKIKIEFLEPISTHNLSLEDIPALKDKIRNAMIDKLRQMDLNNTAPSVANNHLQTS
ncbi:MAG: 1-acyl-sn-glycerol-3-phosphate acyltransferase [Cyclobacteriaceae bacterium]|nr:1-acyl-sn-glycerol-3-phosphate acyltransferase [Cyclobacteriaceae bacterium]